MRCSGAFRGYHRCLRAVLGGLEMFSGMFQGSYSEVPWRFREGSRGISRRLR